MTTKKLVLAIFSVIFPLLISAAGLFSRIEKVDGINYRFYYYVPGYGELPAFATVVSNGEDGYSGDIIIPDSVKGVYSTSEGTFEAYYRVVSIEGDAFINCPELTSLSIPKTYCLRYWEGSDGVINSNLSFKGCTNLVSVVVDPENPAFNSGDNCNAIIETSTGTLVAGCNNSTIPSNVSIGKKAFEGCNFTSITLPNQISTEEEAFKDCENLTTVIIGDVNSNGSIDLGWNTFGGCTKITDIYCYSIPLAFTDYYAPYGSPVLFDDEVYKNAIVHVRDFDVELAKVYSLFKNIVVFDKVTDFNLTYYVDGEIYKTVQYKYDDAITPEPAPTKEGYSFSGWNEVKSNIYLPNLQGKFPSLMPGTDIDVYGSFTANKYKLNYYVDGELYKTYEVACDAATIKEAEPTKEDFEFSGWSEIPETMPAKDMDVTGSFKRIAVTVDDVTYKFDGDNAVVTKDKGKSGDVIIALSVESDGKTYETVGIAENVFKDNANITCVTIPDGVASIGDYAFAGCKSIQKISFGSRIKSIGERAFSNIDKLTDVKIAAEELPQTDRTAFENSYIDDYVTLHVPGSAIKKYKEAAPWKNFKEIVVIPGTEVNETYKLTYMVDGEVYKTVDVKEGDAITPEAVPIKEGYTFSGWGDVPSVMPSQDVTISGTFTINKYKLVYMVDGKEYKSYDVEYKSSITAESAPTKEGYTFSGWSEIPGTMPANDVTITGTFTVNKYRLTYKVDGESYKEYEIEYGSTITAEVAPEKEGYTFSGWSEIPSTMPANDVTITGTFTINRYKLVYQVDGVDYKTYDVEYGASITPEVAPTKEGHTFSGWDNVPGTMPAGDVTVTGYFTVNRYTITYYVDGEVYKTVEVEYGSVITPESEPSKEGYNFSGWSWIPSKMPAEDVVVTGSFTKVSYQVGNSTYEMNEDGVTLTRGEDVYGDLVIDAFVTINGKKYKVTVIGEGAFQGFSRITSVTIPDGVESVMADAFEGCSGIMKLILGKDVRYIGHMAFANASRYVDVRTRAEEERLVVECHSESVPEAEEDCFDNTPIEAGLLLVNDNLFYSYDTTSPWNQFGEIMGFDQYTGITPAFTDEEGATLFSIDGRKLNKPQKGLNIIRTTKGLKKVLY